MLLEFLYTTHQHLFPWLMHCQTKNKKITNLQKKLLSAVNLPKFPYIWRLESEWHPLIPKLSRSVICYVNSPINGYNCRLRLELVGVDAIWRTEAIIIFRIITKNERNLLCETKSKSRPKIDFLTISTMITGQFMTLKVGSTGLKQLIFS